MALAFCRFRSLTEMGLTWRFFSVASVVTVALYGVTSAQEAFHRARQTLIARGKASVNRFAQGLDMTLRTTVLGPKVAKIVIDGSIQGDMRCKLHGDSGAGCDISSNPCCGHRLFKVAADGVLRLWRIRTIWWRGLAGPTGASGTKRLNGTRATENGLPGSLANGGQSGQPRAARDSRPYRAC